MIINSCDHAVYDYAQKLMAYFDKNHKLLAILFTKNGNKNELPIGIMTGANVVEAQKILEDY